MVVLILWQLLVFVFLALPAPEPQARTVPGSGYREWTVYGGTPESIRYSTLDQVNPSNVRNLRLAWRYDSGDEFEGSEMQCNPIIINGILYATTPKLRVIALDATNGKLLWDFNPNQDPEVKTKTRIRGLSYWQGQLYFAYRHHLYAISARNGKPVKGFGHRGRIDLREGLGRDPETLNVSVNTPGVVYKDLLILGSIVSEDLPAAPGDIRAFDVRTGRLRWSFRTIPHPGEFGYDTWPPDAWKSLGGANNWSGMSLDLKRGLVFAGTGSAAFDFYGANRAGDNLFANSLLALRAETGERVWHFQTVRHDIWDRDLPAPPSLVTVQRDGRLIDAVAQITKSGHVFVFERETGKSLFPIEYREVPRSDVEGEVTARRQPFPLEPPPFARQRFTEEIVTRRTPEARRAVLEKLRTVRNGGPFDPPSTQGTILFPGMDGGAEWGGAAFDPATGWLYVNSNEMVWVIKLVERAKAKGLMTTRELYLSQCASCHRDDLKGTPPEFPSLVGLGNSRTEKQLETIIRDGAGRMPGFADLPDEAVGALVNYLRTGDGSRGVALDGESSPLDLKYRLDGYIRFTDPDGYPAVEPPWGTLSAIDLDKGEIAWQIPLGEIPELAAKGLKNTGSENYGGPVVTSGGLLFIGATNHDRKFRAFDKATGEQLWEAELPAAGNATPAVYEVKGRQYIVIAAGGGKWGNPSGGSYLAFALP
jgi:quinoprotein glucose dehydrogenase